MTLFTEIAGKPPEAVSPREAIARDLERICGTRRGALLLAPQYGVDEVTSLFHSFPQIDAWAYHLERSVAAYEPRLGRVRVVPVVSEEPDLTLRAEILAVLMVGGKPSPTRFSATLDARHKLTVR